MPRRKSSKSAASEKDAIPAPKEDDSMETYLMRVGFTKREATGWPAAQTHLPAWITPKIVYECHRRLPPPLRRARLTPRSRFWAQLTRFLRTNDFNAGHGSMAHQFQLFAGGEFNTNQHRRNYKLARAWEAAQTDLRRALADVEAQITHVDVDMPQRRAVAAAMGAYRQMRECLVRCQDLVHKMATTVAPRPYHSLAVRLRAQKARLRQLERRCKAHFARIPGKHVSIARVLGATAEKSGAAPAQRFLVAWTKRQPLDRLHAHWNAAREELLRRAPQPGTLAAGGGAMDARRRRAQRQYEREYYRNMARA